jgi:hypothetical protein
MTLDTMLTLWTMQERFNPDSKFKIYFDTLSENFNTGSVIFLLLFCLLKGINLRYLISQV